MVVIIRANNPILKNKRECMGILFEIEQIRAARIKMHENYNRYINNQLLNHGVGNEPLVIPRKLWELIF